MEPAGDEARESSGGRGGEERSRWEPEAVREQKQCGGRRGRGPEAAGRTSTG